MLLLRRYCTSSFKLNEHRIISVLRDQPIEENIRIQGWVKAIRRHKDLTFVDVNDGSTPQNLQIVLPTKERPPSLGFHSSIISLGVVRASSHKGQAVEFHPNEFEVIGDNDPDTYPFMARVKSSPEYVRNFLHLRSRTKFSSLLRVRSQAKLAMQQHFSEKGFINIDTPILTSNDCEGAGEVFTIETLSTKRKIDDNEESGHKSFFDRPVYLTVSGQLHLEAMASGLSKVYNFNPAFRAESSRTRRHLSEFWMVEAEEAFLIGDKGFRSLADRIENLIKSTIQSVLDSHQDDVSHFWKENPNTEEMVENALKKPFIHLPYHEAMKILLEHSHDFKTEPIPGEDLGKEHELFLAKHLGNVPVFIEDWPSKIKPFYMCSKEDDPNLAYGLDLLFPGVGEMVGGGLREHRFDILKQRLKQRKLLQSLSWYLDLRKLNGRAPSGGFGLGFERFLLFLLGIENIKDTIPFPRWTKHCAC